MYSLFVNQHFALAIGMIIKTTIYLDNYTYLPSTYLYFFSFAGFFGEKNCSKIDDVYGITTITYKSHYSCLHNYLLIQSIHINKEQSRVCQTSFFNLSFDKSWVDMQNMYRLEQWKIILSSRQQIHSVLILLVLHPLGLNPVQICLVLDYMNIHIQPNHL